MTADLGLSIFEPSIQETFFFAFGLCQAAGQGTEEVGCEYHSSSFTAFTAAPPSLVLAQH